MPTPRHTDCTPAHPRCSLPFSGGYNDSALKRLTLPVLALALACSGPDATAPTPRQDRVRTDSAACQGQIIPDPSCEEESIQGYAVASGYGILAEITIDGVPEPPGVPCPVAFYGPGAGEITSLTPPVPFYILGTYRLDPWHQTPRYTFPSGWWDVADGSGREVQIGSADVTCHLDYYPETNRARLRVAFGPQFYNVFVREPISGGGGDSGGGGGGGSNCSTQFITVQVNDGSGWRDWWSGYATVCT